MWIGLDWEKFRFRIKGLGVDVFEDILLHS